MRKWKGLNKLLISLAAIVISLALGAILIVIEGNNPLEAYAILFSSVFSTQVNFGEAVIKAVPSPLPAWPWWWPTAAAPSTWGLRDSSCWARQAASGLQPHFPICLSP